jgi:hypothetical protein
MTPSSRFAHARRLATHSLVALGVTLPLAACPGKDKPKQVAKATIDTTPPNLDSIKAAIPAPVNDTFTPPKPTRARSVSLPSAPPPLKEVVEREQSFSRFCYQEFGQKVDPQLQGGVALIVSVSSNGGISNVRVADDTWSSRVGQEVNRCLLPRAKEAWKVPPGAVKAGDYVVQLTFRGA